MTTLNIIKYITSLNREYLLFNSDDVIHEPTSASTSVQPSKKPETHIRVFACSQCEYIASEARFLEAHMFKHTTDEAVPCPLCPQYFKHELTLRNHITNTHMEHQQVECSLCRKVFKQRTIWKLHMASQHPETQPGHDVNRQFECYVCHEPSVSLPVLRRHMVKHFRAKELLCKQCGYRAQTMQSMERHLLRIDHDAKLSYACTVCGKAFALNYQLSRHTAIHTAVKAFGCDECEKQFRNRSNLMQHKMTHMEPRYNCTLCERKFRSSGNLKKHLIVHQK